MMYCIDNAFLIDRKLGVETNEFNVKLPSNFQDLYFFLEVMNY